MTSASYMVPSNRFNVPMIISSGVFVPLAGFSKHYRDLLDLAPGYVMVVTGPVGKDTAGYLADEGQSSFPVLVETAFEPDGTPDALESNCGPAVIHAVPGALPIKSPRLHFATEDDRAEFAAQDYANFDPSAFDLAVSPQFFENCDQLAEVEDFLTALPQPDPSLRAEIGLVDAFTGAIVMAMQSATTPEHAARVADGPAVLVAGVNGATHTSNLVDYLLDFTGTDPTDQRLLEAVVATLLAEPQVSRDAPRAFVDLLRERLASSGETDPDVSSNLERITEILMGEGELSRLGHGGLETAKALLLYLLRPDPAAILSWFGEIRGAEQATLVLAASFAGITRGYRGLPVDMRGTAALQAVLSAAQADAINAVRGDIVGRVLPKAPTFRATVGAGDPGHITVSYKYGNSRLLDCTRADLTLRGELLRADLAKGDRCSEAVAIAKRLGWRECIVTSIRFKAGGMDSVGGETRLRITGRFSMDESVEVEEYRNRLMSAEESKLAETLEALERDLAEHPPISPRRPESAGVG